MCVGLSGDISNPGQSLLVKLDANGNVLQKKLYTTNNTVHNYYNSQSAHSLVIARKGDFIVGGERWSAPWIMRLDSLGNAKWSTWYYDSTKGVSGFLLQGHGIINCLRETRRGSIVCAVGDDYPDNGGNALNNYAAYLELDSTGHILPSGVSEWNDLSWCNIGGFDIEETQGGQYLLSGNEGVYYLDTEGSVLWHTNYSFFLTGVGTEINRVNRAKVLRNNTPIVAGMAYEGNCWTNYSRLYYDAWWSPISYAGGGNTTWDTAGAQGGSDGLYDFTQLINGNLVYIGTKATVADSGMWAFVTDSTGKNLLWEKQFNIPYRSDVGRALLPLSVCATSDSGFTVVGYSTCTDSLGGVNAFAAHFVPRPPVILPGPVTLVSPSNAATNQPVSLTLVWHSATNALTYHVQVATSSGFSTIFTQDSTLTDTSISINGLANGTVYYWRVRAKNTDGVSAWATYRRFTTIVAPPATPNLVSPTDGAIITVDSVRLVWNRAVPAVDKYLVDVATDSAMTNGTLHYTLPSQCFVSIRYYDIRGRMVASFIGRVQGAGNYSLRLPVSSWGMGAYVQVFTAGEIVRKDRMMVIK